MVVVVAPDAVDADAADARRPRRFAPGASARSSPADDAAARATSRSRSRARPMSGRIAVGVSGAGSNLRALVAAADRGASSAARSSSSFADRACPALDWAAEQGIDTALVPAAARRRGRSAARTRSGRGADAAAVDRRRPGRLHARSSARRPWRVRRPDPEHPSERSCRRSRAPTPSATRSPTARRSPARPSTSSTRPSTAARSSPRRRSRSCPTTTRRASTSGSRRSSTGCCRGSSRSLLAGAVGSSRADGGVAIDVERAEARRPGPAPGAPVGQRQDRPRRPRRAASSAAASSWSRPAARPGRCATRACRSPTSPPSRASRRCSTAGSRRSTRAIHAGILADRRLRRPPAPAGRRGDRPVRARRRQPLPVRGGRRAARDRRSTSSSRRSTSAARRWSARRPRTTPAWRS